MLGEIHLAFALLMVVEVAEKKLAGVALRAAIALPGVRRTSTRNGRRGTWWTGLQPTLGQPREVRNGMCGAPSEWRVRSLLAQFETSRHVRSSVAVGDKRHPEISSSRFYEKEMPSEFFI